MTDFNWNRLETAGGA